ncbi:hypothetical protein NQD34_005276 [Periophthalmus magnuspinnatus]|nr:hypothetical protein NQD34_005276 [Periophthalmus magnuspinnatus]
MMEAMFEGVHSSSICAKHGLLQFKVLYQLLFSKEKFYPGTDLAHLYMLFGHVLTVTVIQSSIYRYYPRHSGALFSCCGLCFFVSTAPHSLEVERRHPSHT